MMPTNLSRALRAVALAGVCFASIAGGGQAAAGEPPTVGLGPCPTAWTRSPSCPGHQPELGARLGRETLAGLAELKAVRQVQDEQAKARWLLSSEIMCMPAHVQWNLSLVDPATAEMVWIKAFEARSTRELAGSRSRAVRLLLAFLREGKAPDEVEPEPDALAGEEDTGQPRAHAMQVPAFELGLAGARKALRSLPR
ncbi:MAG TPA: hypothetical protein PK668_17700 [Myxococcota bacterium]|nr:hypothetical protein [Myxococcota bacterium]HRY95796.1 hypothetical protein [Myxococcota bacterium]HSA21163.1 hypothetical protein [Myxococcota bacterium]